MKNFNLRTAKNSELMLDIIQELDVDVKPIAHSAKLKDIKAILTIVDGTLMLRRNKRCLR